MRETVPDKFGKCILEADPIEVEFALILLVRQVCRVVVEQDS
jgi:hypothetical protein